MSGPRILVLDIERKPGLARVWGPKVHYIPAQNFVAYPQTICYAYKWHGEKRIEFSAEWHEGGHKAMIQKAWDLYNEAHAVVGYNSKGFDNKHLASDWGTYEMGPPSPYKDIDLLSAARARFGFEIKTLDEVTKRFGLGGKTDKYDMDVAEAAVAGDEKAQNKLARYNRGDVRVTDELFDMLLPWIPNMPHLGLYSDSDQDTCRCGSENLERRGYAFTDLGKYRQYHCRDCGRWPRGKRAVELMEAR